MKLIITRPQDDAELLARRLGERGHVCICVPLIEIVPRNAVEIPQLNWQAVIFTSANAIRSLDNIDTLRRHAAFVVGPQSAAAAKARGFDRIEICGGDMTGLVTHIRKILAPDNGPLLYVSGSVTSGDLTTELGTAGFAVTRIITYDAIPTSPTELHHHAASADGVLLYSARSATLWLAATQGAKSITHYCLSQNVASQLPPIVNKRIAPTPDDEGMFLLLASTPEAA
jgi:uroporphyrinogen-III synthase